MIHELRIRALGVIDEAVIPFAPGFTVVTGETGAGKTMVLTGLGLVRGDKADSSLVRTGAAAADVDAEWRLPADPAAGWTGRVLERIEEAGGSLEADGGESVLLIGRSVSSGGRSRAFAGGRSVPAATLAELGEALMTVHGQADQLLIRDPRHQRALLDMFGGPGLLDVRERYATEFAAWRGASRELRDLVERRQDREREAALLRHGIDEIAAVDPQPGEDDALKAQATVLAHATDLLAQVASAHADLVGGDEGTAAGVAESLVRVHRAIERAAVLDASLAPLVEHLDRIIESVSVVSGELAAYARDVEADPSRLSQVEERRQAISALKRRYGPELDDVLAWWAAAEAEVGSVDGTDARVAELTAEVDQRRVRVVADAHELTSQRRAAAALLGIGVTAELRDLAMPDAALTVEVVTTQDPDQLTAEGGDTVTMRLMPHAGSESRPLAKGASGGELSRIMLALEVVLAGVDSVPTFVFDEVDAGIGGRVAVEVGRRLARLARTSQVIVVTHLPQVAAFADHHVVVMKDGSGQVTASSVTVVDGQHRVRELVRMLSGLEDSQSGAEHAAELLALADEDRAAAQTTSGTAAALAEGSPARG